MKIPSLTPPAPPAIATDTVASRNAEAGGAGVSGGGGRPADQARWGASAQALTEQAMQQPTVRGPLVEHYRGQIAAGTYQVAPREVAAAMLGDPLTGLGKRERG